MILWFLISPWLMFGLGFGYGFMWGRFGAPGSAGKKAS